MAMEVACGNCQGRLMIAEAGIVVACPHCGTHLSIPAPDASETAPPAPEPEPVDAPHPVSEAAPPQPQPLPATQPPPAVIQSPPPATQPPASAAQSPIDSPTEPVPDFTNLKAAAQAPVTEFPSFDSPSPVPAPTATAPDSPATPAEPVAAPPASDADPQLSVPQPDESTSNPTLPDVAAVATTEPESVPAVAAPETTAEPPPIPEASSDTPEAAPVDPVLEPAAARETFKPTPAAPSIETSVATPIPIAPAAAPVETAISPPNSVAAAAPATPSVPRLWFVVIASYASAVTIALIWLWASNRTAHRLENLPDVVPKMHNGEIVWEKYQEDAAVAPGHTLKLSESRRFGSLLLTPVKVTRAPLTFVTRSGAPQTMLPPSQPVLKLWLQFENVSEDQTFAPLDDKLLLNRKFLENEANTFVCQVGEKQNDGQRVLVYDHPPWKDWSFRIQDQKIEDELRLKPGEKLTTFIATMEDGIEDLEGDLVWRVHFRKGYHPKTRHGVTTLIEINFNSDQISTEDAG